MTRAEAGAEYTVRAGEQGRSQNKTIQNDENQTFDKPPSLSNYYYSFHQRIPPITYKNTNTMGKQTKLSTGAEFQGFAAFATHSTAATAVVQLLQQQQQ